EKAPRPVRQGDSRDPLHDREADRHPRGHRAGLRGRRREVESRDGGTMEETPTETPKASSAPARTRRAPARRKPAAARAKAPARRRKAPVRRRAASRAGVNSMASLLGEMASRAAAAGKEIKALSGKGAGAARKAWNEVGATSRRTIRRLTKEWEGMDS